jgi:hypothetical protein
MEMQGTFGQSCSVPLRLYDTPGGVEEPIWSILLRGLSSI